MKKIIKINTIFLLVFLFSLSACTAGGESGGIDYEQQLMATSMNYFSLDEQEERTQMKTLLILLNTMEEQDQGFLAGFLAGCDGGYSFSCPYHRLSFSLPPQVGKRLMDQARVDAYLTYDEAKMAFFQALEEHSETQALWDQTSEFRKMIPSLLEAFEKVNYDHTFFPNDQRQSQYIRELQAFTVLLQEAQSLLNA